MEKLYILLLAGTVFANNPDALSKAAAALKVGMFREALLHVSDAQEENPTNPDVYRMKALLLEALDEPKNALEAWKNCLEYSTDEHISREANIHIQSLSEK